MAVSSAVLQGRAAVSQQLYYMMGRTVRAWYRHPVMLIGEGVQYIFLALFVGGMYFDVSSEAQKGTFDREAATFFMLVTIAFTPPFTVITVWQGERGLVRKEVGQNVYSIDIFYWAKTAILLPVEATFSALVGVISYWMFGFQEDAAKFFIYCAIIFLTLTTSESMGMIFAMTTKTGETAIVIASLVFILLLSLTGFLTSDMPAYYAWIRDISFLRYANSGAFLNEMNGLTLTGPDGQDVRGEDLADGSTLDNDLSVGENIGVLAAMLVAFRLAAYGGLKLANRFKLI